MRDHRLSAAGEGLPDDLRARFDACTERSDWIGAIALLLIEAERRTDVRERVACYLRAAALYERQFANSAEAQAILEYVLGLSPGEPAATLRLHELYTRARRREKLRWLAEAPHEIAAQARVPRPPASHAAGIAGAPTGTRPEGTVGLPARIGAAGLFIALPASVVVASMHATTLAEPHDNAGGAFGWLTFASLDLAFCAAFVALVWLPARWALRRVGGRALLVMLALLAATFLIAMVPTLGWNAIDAMNVLLDPNAPSVVRVRVVDHARSGKGRARFSVVQEQSGHTGSTRLMRSLALEPIGSEHLLRRGAGFFRRTYYLPPQRKVSQGSTEAFDREPH